ncbi:Delta(24)-sterol reductase [Ceratocystis fimbriata CBS 114723]|uniref:Delta(24)-sterol reductase n=1 Tax=Ceratocystis fimbriata CBS 114723 TaxID=1035309 RepID=A0A2C5X1P1_9PEZI|nr:Delta(24)-sterol reductase [Ceratocystis fimbriata CBS 114723]
MEHHKKVVGTIANTVRQFFDKKEPYRIFHGSTNSTRPAKAAGPSVDISALDNVLSVSRATRTAIVEPNVPMDRLVEATLKHGLVPPIVMEFPGITAGGGYAGTAGESSSFKHGYFDDTIDKVEMVLGNGEVIETSRTQHADLFKGAAGAVGSLGITTLITLQLMEAKRYVKTTYHRAGSVSEAIALVRAQTANKANDYVDGILFSKDHGVVVTGELTNEKPAQSPVQTFSNAHDPWFYLHAAERTRDAPSSATSSSPSAPAVDYIPLAEYLFRYDRGAFWVGACAFEYFKFVPFNRFTRWLLNDFLHTRMLYRALHGSGESARFIVQDMGLPYSRAEEFINYTAESFNIWPLWLCPLKRAPPPTFHPHADGESTNEMLNLGLWGWGPTNRPAFVAKNRELEKKLQEVGGHKWFYAHTYYEEDEFWKIYGREWYDALREKYHATHLPSVYDKVKVNVPEADKASVAYNHSVLSRRPLGGLVGLIKSIQSGDYQIHRSSQWKHKVE